MQILVVEDEPFIRLGLVSTLEDAGYSAIEAANADEALLILHKTQDVALIVTDVDMPGSMDGVRLAHFVRQRWAQIRLVVTSGKVGLSEVHLPTGARFIAKPFQDHKLLAQIRDLLSPPDMKTE